jgi:hypothetical protein
LAALQQDPLTEPPSQWLLQQSSSKPQELPLSRPFPSQQKAPFRQLRPLQQSEARPQPWNSA